MKAELFKSTYREERDRRDIAIYRDWQRLTSIEGQSKIRVLDCLMEKYGIHSRGTIYIIRRRAEKLLNK